MHKSFFIFLPSCFQCIFLAFFLFFPTSCSFLERNTADLFSSPQNPSGTEPLRPRFEKDSAPLQTSRVQIDEVQPEKMNSDVEIIWNIPEELVDGYIICYGYSAENLEFQQKVTLNEIEKVEDPKYGLVYRYRLENIPPEKNVSVSISAFRDEEVSGKSNTISVPVTK